MDIAQRVQLNTAKSDVRSHDVIILLGYSVLAILLLIAIFFASRSSGTAAADFASMVAFP